MKHSKRGKEGFWERVIGESFSGGDAQKNTAAHKLLCQLLDEAVWGNLHSLPGELLTYEVRVRQGYGARWTSEETGVVFRGLLEPQMWDGHDKAWRHDLTT